MALPDADGWSHLLGALYLNGRRRHAKLKLLPSKNVAVQRSRSLTDRHIYIGWYNNIRISQLGQNVASIAHVSRVGTGKTGNPPRSGRPPRLTLSPKRSKTVPMDTIAPVPWARISLSCFAFGLRDPDYCPKIDV
ncbi:MAG: hypothetical protein Q9172_002077 [Xanthocarpia lactea]